MNKGITLIETVVAVTVLVMALGGPFLLAAKSLRTSGYAREEITAARLAEEGLESIHNMRDNNAGDGVQWDKDISACSSGCILDITKMQNIAEPSSIWDMTGSSPALLSCGGICSGEQHRVYKHTSGLYRQFSIASGIPIGYTATQMTRSIKINSIESASREYLIESTVTYMAGGQLRTITLTDTILNWFPNMSTLF